MERFLKEFYSSYSCKEYRDGILLSTPIMYQGADHTFSFYITQNKTGSFTISDNGETLDYMRENFNPEKYMDKIMSVCERFSITLENNAFIGKIASYESNQAMRTFNIFIGAMNIIANIDIFEDWF